jgi:NitT/TauT family transport system permease protein
MASDKVKRNRKLAKYAQISSTFIVLLIVWQVGVKILDVKAYILPPPTQILLELFNSWDLIYSHAFITASEILIGFFLSIAIGIPMALAISFSRFFQRTLYPILVFFQLIPKIALAPLFIIWFGFGIFPKILITFLLSFFPVVIDSIVGFTSLHIEAVYLARSMGASNKDFFFKVQLPNALPNIFAGIKMAMAFSTVGAVVGEFVGSSEGLGYLLLVANGDLNTQLLFACLLVLSTIGLIFYYIIELIEKVSIPWHISKRPLEGGATL